MSKKILYPLYILKHPFEGFYAMRHENRSGTPVAFLYLFLFWVVYSLNKQYAGFVVNRINPLTLNTLFDLVAVVALFFLFAVANWSITTLMNGEGKFKDIIMATAFAMTPMIILYIPATVIGNYVARNEEAFYFLLISISAVWFMALLFIGIMTIHGYGFFKTIITFFLTLVAMLVIVFLLLLMTTLIQQVIMFIVSIYRELIFRA